MARSRPPSLANRNKDEIVRLLMELRGYAPYLTLRDLWIEQEFHRRQQMMETGAEKDFQEWLALARLLVQFGIIDSMEDTYDAFGKSAGEPGPQRS